MKYLKKLLSWVFDILMRPAKYDPQKLSAKQLLLLDEFDTELSNMFPIPEGINTFMSIKSCEIRMIFCHMSHKALLHTLTQNITGDYSYIPRSIAFMTDADGNWKFYYALRSNEPSDNIILSDLFLDALNRTNNARSKNI